MENEINNTKEELYTVYDEMACEILLETSNLKTAQKKAFNYQCLLINNKTRKVIKDYSE